MDTVTTSVARQKVLDAVGTPSCFIIEEETVPYIYSPPEKLLIGAIELLESFVEENYRWDTENEVRTCYECSAQDIHSHREDCPVMKAIDFLLQTDYYWSSKFGHYV